MGESNQFNLPLGEAAKEAGMYQAASSRKSLLQLARGIAENVALMHGEVTADDVMERLGVRLGNAAGSLFRGPNWEFTGRWRKSARVSNHARMNRIWRLKI